VKSQVNQRFSLVPVVILLVAFVLRIANLTGESLWRDEVDSVRFAFQPLRTILGNFTTTGFNGPLYHLSLRVWLTLAGVNDFALRYLSLVCGVALVALVYALAQRLFDRRTALVAAWLGALSPALIWYAGEGKMYTLQPLLLVLALYALVRAVGARRSRSWWLICIVSTSFSFYTHLLSPLFLVVAVVFFVALWPQSRAHVRGGLIALACLTLPYLPLAIWQLPTVIHGGDVGHTFYPLDVIARTLLANWTVGLDGRAPLLDSATAPAAVDGARWLVLALYVALMLYGVLSASTARQTRLSLAVLAWLALPTLMVFGVSLRFPVFQPRYLLWSAPALYILVGIGLAQAWREGALGRWAAQLAVVLLSMVCVVGWTAQVIHPIRPDLRGATSTIVQGLQPGDAVVFQIPYGRYGFEYYAPHFGLDPTQVHIVEAPYTNYGMGEDEVTMTMTQTLGGARRVWLYETEAEMWDMRALVRAWADRDLHLIDNYDLRGVRVGLYTLP